MKLAIVRPALCGGRNHQGLCILGDLQRTVYICDLVVRCYVSLAVLHNSCTRDVRLGSHFSDRTGHCYAVHSVCSLQSCRSCILPSIVRQRCAVVFLAVTVSSDCQRRLRNLQPAIRNCQICLRIIYIFICANSNGKGRCCQTHRITRISIDIGTLGLRSHSIG